MIAAGRTRRVSVGRAGERYFLLMAGVGLDAALVRAVNPTLKRLTGQGAFWIAAFQQFVRWEPRRFLVDVEGQRYEATFALFANAACYAGGMRIAPRASMESDHLDLCLIDWTERRRFVRHARAGFTGTLPGLPGVTYLQVRARHGPRQRRVSGPGGRRAARAASDDVQVRAGGPLADRAVSANPGVASRRPHGARAAFGGTGRVGQRVHEGKQLRTGLRARRPLQHGVLGVSRTIHRRDASHPSG